MRRKIVFSIDQTLTGRPEAAKLVLSKGMRAASSFATRFQIMALLPWAEVFTSGTPEENSYLYCDSPARRDLLSAIDKASLIAIKIRYDEAAHWDSKYQNAIVCEISFRRDKVTFQIDSFFYLLDEEESSCHSISHRDRGEEVFLTPLDDLEKN